MLVYHNSSCDRKKTLDRPKVCHFSKNMGKKDDKNVICCNYLKIL